MDPSETPQAAVLSSERLLRIKISSFGSSTGKQKSKVHMLASGEDQSRVEGFISRRGSELALKHLCKKFGASLFDMIPKLWDCLTEVLKPVVRSAAPMLDQTLRPKLLTLLPCIFKCIRHSHVVVRLAASRCIASMAKSMTVNVMGAVIVNVIPMLGDMTPVHARQGAGILVSLLVQGLGVELVSYAPLLVVPLLSTNRRYKPLAFEALNLHGILCDDMGLELHKLHHSPKLVALREILEECGIGVDASSSEGCAFLDIIERDLYHGHMKSKTLGVPKPGGLDHCIGGLLSNLLAQFGSTVGLFKENLIKAMDRAHRLGQRKVVNVHRLIMRGTLEEKVMSLQKFKVSVANSVINAENASMKTMNTDQLLDLFTSAETKKVWLTPGHCCLKGSDGNFDGDTKSVGTGKD
ncbi:TATA-binding protein-associated factor BTAF1 [Camellia lanceoleosa]|uniref:TATA-binding protein-associated factor BTAF1 n=1 Tax=Camellia lanceoleosa TaxID=1840588 RepID=A0ACC0FJT5_9ERIC|nr:TATA-binding protein-associated factor BTAF1 [Camellia lanceoleosa]